MGDCALHSYLTKEKREATLDECQKGRYSIVGDLAIKAVEQAIEATASREGKHFHVRPRTAHAERVKWVKKKFPSLSKDVDVIWGTYGALGYDGADGNRAKKAIEAMERILNEISSRTGIKFR